MNTAAVEQPAGPQRQGSSEYLLAREDGALEQNKHKSCDWNYVYSEVV